MLGRKTVAMFYDTYADDCLLAGSRHVRTN